MNQVTCLVGAAIVAVATSCATANADPGKTREQVPAELIAAQQAGDFPENENGMTTPEVFHCLYGADTAVRSGKTRAEVHAELAAAQRAGDVRIRLFGFTPRELFPDSYPLAVKKKTPGQTVAQAAGRAPEH